MLLHAPESASSHRCLNHLHKTAVDPAALLKNTEPEPGPGREIRQQDRSKQLGCSMCSRNAGASQEADVPEREESSLGAPVQTKIAYDMQMVR